MAEKKEATEATELMSNELGTLGVRTERLKFPYKPNFDMEIPKGLGGQWSPAPPDPNLILKALPPKAEGKSDGISSSAPDILQDAVNTLKARAVQRDAESSGERSIAKAVALFNTWTGQTLSTEEGWRFMICLKMAREIQGKFNVDDYVDLAAYAALLGEETGSKKENNNGYPSLKPLTKGSSGTAHRS